MIAAVMAKATAASPFFRDRLMTKSDLLSNDRFPRSESGFRYLLTVRYFSD
jgi:hypothetical protein